MAKKLTERDPGRGLLGWLFRAPQWLYKLRLGWLLGNRFLMLTHIGRRSEEQRSVVLEVVTYNKELDTYVVASAWGEKSQWFRNIAHNPSVVVEVGTRQFAGRATQLSDEQAWEALRQYALAHPAAFRNLTGLIVGQRLEGKEEDCRILAEAVRLVALQPEDSGVD